MPTAFPSFHQITRKITYFGSQGTAEGQLSKPHGVTTDQDDNIYVTDGGNYRVQKFSSNGKFVAKIGSKGNGDLQFNNPDGHYLQLIGYAALRL